MFVGLRFIPFTTKLLPSYNMGVFSNACHVSPFFVCFKFRVECIIVNAMFLEACKCYAWSGVHSISFLGNISLYCSK